MALDTVADYIAEGRRLLQDNRVPYRYSDSAFISAVNFGLLEMRRIRPELFLGRLANVPTYTSVNNAVDVDPQYRIALSYYVTGRVGIQDDEAADETRAGTFMQKFIAQLLTVQA